jgi:ribosomal protein S18 acetylase RimI-like enzyme
LRSVRSDAATPTDVTIRKADQRDVPELSALAIETYVDAVGHTFRPSDLDAYLEGHLSEDCFSRTVDEDTVLLAFLDGRMVGFVQFGAVKLPVEPRSGSDRELHRLYVDLKMQDRGVGRQLMDAALTEMRRSGAANVYLDVWERNEGAIRFYRRYGFETVGSHRIAVESGAKTERDLIMVRALRDVP